MAENKGRSDGRLVTRFKDIDVETVRKDILTALSVICRTLQWEPSTCSKDVSDTINALVSSWKELKDSDQFTIMDEDAAPDEPAQEAGELPAQVAAPGN